MATTRPARPPPVRRLLLVTGAWVVAVLLVLDADVRVVCGSAVVDPVVDPGVAEEAPDDALVDVALDRGVLAEVADDSVADDTVVVVAAVVGAALVGVPVVGADVAGLVAPAVEPDAAVGVSGSSVRPAGAEVEPNAGTVTSGTGEGAGPAGDEPGTVRPPAVVAGPEGPGADCPAGAPQAASSSAAMP